MRPTKLTPALLDAFRAVLADELAAVAFTEEELVWQANQHLPLEQQITYRTFQRYKAEIMSSEAGIEENEEDKEETQKTPEEQQTDAHNTELVRQMYITLKSALFKQKRALVNGVMEGLPNWRRYSWMLERKFPDFRLKLLPKNDAESHKTGSDEVGTKTDTAKPGPVKTLVNPKAPPKPELTVLQKMQQKWHYKIPWAPLALGSQQSVDAEELYKIEDDLAYDEATTDYKNPFAHYGYVPDERRTGGFYVFKGMGEDKLCHRRYIGPDDSRLALSQTVIDLQWEEQEKERQQVLANKADEATEAEYRRIEARKAARLEALGGGSFYEPSLNYHDDEPAHTRATTQQPDPWDGEPRPAPNPNQPSNGGGRIYGFSA